MIGSAIFSEGFSEDNLNLIARGGFSQIFVTSCNLTNQPIVIKKMKNDDESTLNFLSQEANCIQKLNDENPNIKNIIKIYSNYQRGNCIYIAMEYCPQGSLEKLLLQKQKLTHYEILIFAKQMISALMYAHRLGLVHSDLKPENVLIRKENEYVLTDWGSAQQLNHQHSTTLRDNTYFTPGYQAPELQNENLISSNMKFNYFIADIYSLGMMLLRCTGPSFREIRTISSEADQGDHDWKINKHFKSYIFQKEYQDGVIDKIISGFLSYSKASRMKLEEALGLINLTYPNLESCTSVYQQESMMFEEQSNTFRNSMLGVDHIDDSFNLSQLLISTVQNPNPAVNLQQNSLTIPKKNNSQYRNYISSINQSLQQQAQLTQKQQLLQQQQQQQLIQQQQQQNFIQMQAAQSIQFQFPQNSPSFQNQINPNQQSSSNTLNYKNNIGNANNTNLFVSPVVQPTLQNSGKKSSNDGFQDNQSLITDFCKNIENMGFSNSSSSSGSGSNQSSKKVEKTTSTVDRKDSSRQRMREIKRNRSQDKFRANKNISITNYCEIVKISPDVDNLKAYLLNQVSDANIMQICQKINDLTNIKKLFLSIGGHAEFTDNSIYSLQMSLQNKRYLQELMLDLFNSPRVSLSAVNNFLKGIPSNLESLSLSLIKIQIVDGDFDDFVSILMGMKNLKRLSISFSQCQAINEDDLDYICETVEDCEQFDKFHLICPNEDKAASVENRLANQISEVKISVSG